MPSRSSRVSRSALEAGTRTRAERREARADYQAGRIADRTVDGHIKRLRRDV